MLVEHRVHDVDERLVAVEESVPSGEQITLQPTLALVLAEHLHHAAGGRKKFVARHGRGVPLPLGHFEERFQAIGKRLVGAEDPEVALLQVQLRHVAQERSQQVRVAFRQGAGRRHVHGVIAEIRHVQIVQQQASVGVGIGAHAPVAVRGKFGQFRSQAALLVEKLFGPVAP